MNIHATVIALGPVGLIIEGASGTGKTHLALSAIEKFQSHAGFAALVADDQCLIEAVNGRLVATCPPALAGLAELRGFGITTQRHIMSVVIDVVIRLVDGMGIERMPTTKTAIIAGTVLPLFELPARQIAVSLPILSQIVSSRRI